jgi:hypothetical protein
MGSVHARGDTFLTFGLKALTETNTSRLATGTNTVRHSKEKHSNASKPITQHEKENSTSLLCVIHLIQFKTQEEILNFLQQLKVLQPCNSGSVII